MPYPTDPYARRLAYLADAENRAHHAVVGVAVTAVIAAAATVARLVQLATVGAADGTPTATQRTFEDWVHQPLGQLTSLAFLVTGVLWIRWFDATYLSVETTGRTRHSVYWLDVGWLVPVLNVVLPGRFVADVWRAGEPAGTRAPLPWQLHAWWALWTLMWVGLLGSLLAFEAGRLVWGVATVAAAPFAIVTVRLLTARLRRVADIALPPPVPADDTVAAAQG